MFYLYCPASVHQSSHIIYFFYKAAYASKQYVINNHHKKHSSKSHVNIKVRFTANIFVYPNISCALKA